MGYEIHITRKETWHDDEDPASITSEEWEEYIKSKSDMRLDNQIEVELEDGSKLKWESEGLAVWTGYSGEDKSQNHAWFSYGYGNITVKNPDEEILKKMCLMAKEFNAKVQGDEEELYEDGKQVTFAEKWVRPKPWWKFW